jgi:hypothetical protein
VKKGGSKQVNGHVEEKKLATMRTQAAGFGRGLNIGRQEGVGSGVEEQARDNPRRDDMQNLLEK